MAKKVSGTKKVDTITVNESNVIVVTGKKTETTPITKSGKNYIFGDKGNDIIFVKGSKKNYIYGDDKKHKISGKDKITIASGTDNIVYGGKGNDTITINGGSKNTIYGGAGKDTFIFGKKGSATIKDYRFGQDTLKFSSGIVTSAKLSGKDNVIFKAGNASATLAGVAKQAVSLKDKRGSYIVSDTMIALGKDFTGTMNVNKYLTTVTTIDGRKATKAVNITGNALNNTIYVGNAGGTVNGGAGNDRIYVGYEFNSNKMTYGTQTINAGDGDNYIEVTFSQKGKNKITINGGKDTDEIWINDAKSKNMTINGGGGFNIFDISGTGHTVIGDAGSDNYEIKGTGHVLKNVGGGDNIDIVESMAGRSLTIERKFYADDIDNEDVIYFRSDAVEDMKFATSDDLLTITHKNGGGLSISNWDSERTLLIIFGDYSDPAYDRFTIGTNVKVQGATPG